MGLIDTVRQTIRSRDLIHKGDHIVLGLSGGPDSVCLFHVLQRLAPEYDLTIHPVHVNHKFRPGAAEHDQAYVENLCRKATSRTESPSVKPCRTFIVDCNALAEELGMTGEEAGRQARYDAFYQVAMEAAEAGNLQTPGNLQPPGTGVCIAVAQNANDQAETILHRILRGTGTDGLSGIAYKRYERGIPVIRPLLDVPRTEIEAYCEEHGLDPVTDHTNNEPVYTRNKIRLELLPMLEGYNDNIIDTLTRLGRIAAADKEYIWQQTETIYKGLIAEGPGGSGDEKGRSAAEEASGRQVVLDRIGLAAQPDAIRHRIIVKAFGEIGLASDISEERLRAADAIITKKQAPKTVQFPRGYRLTVAKGLVYFA